MKFGKTCCWVDMRNQGYVSQMSVGYLGTLLSRQIRAENHEVNQYAMEEKIFEPKHKSRKIRFVNLAHLIVAS